MQSAPQPKYDSYAKEAGQLIGEIERVKIKVEEDIKRLTSQPNFSHGHGNSIQFGGMWRAEFDPIRTKARALKQRLVEEGVIDDSYELEQVLYSSLDEHESGVVPRLDQSINILKGFIKAAYTKS